MAERKRGSFIVFEGIDGSGKTTQLALLKRRLDAAGIRSVCTREPTGGPVGALLRQILSGRVVSDPRVAAPLFVADRLDHLLNPVDGVLKAIGEGTNVLMDRYYFSSYAYQSVDLPMAQVIGANAPCAELLRPTVSLFIDVDPEEAMRRISAGRSRTELFETRERLAAARARYFEAFDRLRDAENIVIVDGAMEESALEAEIWERLKGYFLHGTRADSTEEGAYTHEPEGDQ